VVAYHVNKEQMSETNTAPELLFDGTKSWENLSAKAKKKPTTLIARD
jgi:hypothetical protein